MLTRLVLIGSLYLFAANAGASQDSIYCPQGSQYVSIGMTVDQVIDACGTPVNKRELDTPATKRIPVTQLVYNSQGGQSSPYAGQWQNPKYSYNNYDPHSAFYGVWTIDTGFGSGARVEIDIADNKVLGIKLNGDATNSLSTCGSVSINPGDPASKVYGSCGNPSFVNNTFIEIPIDSATNPQVWTFQAGQFQPVITLTIVDGKLQSIN